jgi:hypothetical protein
MQKVIVLNQSLALTKRWSGRLCDLKSAAHLRTDSSVRKSSSNMSTSAPLELSRMYVAASCALSALRHARNTFIPSRAKDRAVSLPMPVLEPVTIATRLESFILCLRAIAEKQTSTATVHSEPDKIATPFRRGGI